MDDSFMKKTAYEQVLLGSLLGDGSLFIRHRGRNPVFSEMHSLRQLEYLKWKNRFLRFRFTIEKKRDKRSGVMYRHCRINSGAEPAFWHYYRMFYHNRRKVISKAVLKKLDLLAIAVWYCDDGCYGYQSGSMIISVNCFSAKGRRLIIEYFKEKFGFNFTPNGKRLYLCVDDTKKFVTLIEDIVPKSMRYKLGKDLINRERQRHKNIIFHRKYWRDNRERLLAQQRRNYLKNREKRLLHQKNYYLKHKEKILIQKQEYRRRIKEGTAAITQSS